MLIAPVLLDVIHYTQAQLRIEYPLTVTDQLKGSLDYYLYTDDKFLVVEAKHANLARDFTQLAVELIALDQWCDDPSRSCRERFRLAMFGNLGRYSGARNESHKS